MAHHWRWPPLLSGTRVVLVIHWGCGGTVDIQALLRESIGDDMWRSEWRPTPGLTAQSFPNPMRLPLPASRLLRHLPLRLSRFPFSTFSPAFAALLCYHFDTVRKDPFELDPDAIFELLLIATVTSLTAFSLPHIKNDVKVFLNCYSMVCSNLP